MNHANLLIVADRAEQAEHWIGPHLPPLLGRGFSTDRLSFATIDALAADPTPLVPGLVVWVIAGADTAGQALYELLANVQDRHVPTAFSPVRPGQLGAIHQDSIAVLPCETDPAGVVAVLGALASQAQSIESLKTEAKLLRAHHVGMADQIGKIDEELRMAVKIQREFLPKTFPNLEPFRFDVLWRPAGYVSGDIYDVTRLDEHHVGVFIADAVGHGVPAALMTVYIKQALRTKEMTLDAPGYRLLSPDEVLSHLNRMLLEQDGGATCFATAVYAIIDTRTGVMRIARAGHPLPALLSPGQSTRMLDADGPMLGVFECDEFEVQEIELGPDDRLLLYSDGFEMAFPDPDHESVANEQYLDEFEKLRNSETPEALRRFTALIDHQAGSLNQRDDLTLLCVSVSAEAQFATQPAEEETVSAQAA